MGKLYNMNCGNIQFKGIKNDNRLVGKTITRTQKGALMITKLKAIQKYHHKSMKWQGHWNGILPYLRKTQNKTCQMNYYLFIKSIKEMTSVRFFKLLKIPLAQLDSGHIYAIDKVLALEVFIINF